MNTGNSKMKRALLGQLMIWGDILGKLQINHNVHIEKKEEKNKKVSRLMDIASDMMGPAPTSFES